MATTTNAASPAPALLQKENSSADVVMKQRVYEFSEGNKNDQEILGVRGQLLLFEETPLIYCRC
jgi:hypothetical protein